MMLLFYNLAVFFYRLVIQLAAFSGNRKAKLWISGRKDLFSRLRLAMKPGEKRVWFHCSSLGEFEQGRPLLEKFKKEKPEYKIVLTFFSPSGYENRKNYDGADFIFYLPLDTRSNAKEFISMVNPSNVFFIKYEYWFHYLRELKKNNIPVYLVSAIFRKKHRFFRWYGSFFRDMLRNVSYFFLQDEQSERMLHSIGISSCKVTGDTRFDRVVEIASQAKSFPLIEKFKNGFPLLIAGSTWEKDEQVLVAVMSKMKQENRKLKMVIAPHETGENRIRNVMQSFSTFKTIRYSEAKEENISSAEVMVIDSIGVLSSLYRYGSFAFIGGGFGSGIHNTLEAAVFGMPVFFGTNYKRFQEAVDLVDLGVAFSVSNEKELADMLKSLLSDESKRLQISSSAKNYVEERKGASEKILEFLR